MPLIEQGRNMDFLSQMYKKAKYRANLIEKRPSTGIPVVPFKPALWGHGISIIAEVKYATPSEGSLGIKKDPSTLAGIYEESGASAISCITEPDYFAGDLSYISQIRSNCKLPILMKDFIVDERQISAGRDRGADAFLLITEMLSLKELDGLYTFGKGLGMDPLVEVHTKEGMEKALEIGAEIIGVNARSLATLEVVPDRHEEMIGNIPGGVIKVAQSGVTSRKRLIRLRALGYDAVLIGRALADATTRKELFSCG
ncbi:MAG: indole-3-glycerol-phosphate synthase [Deltaproteobacteria bacterium]|nr:indole-3-glycerol-phosphate synthase [Deltaproteobacteria bacterium]